MLILNDPNNPTGVKMNRAEIAGLAALLSKPEFKHILVVSDETYHDLVYGDVEEQFCNIAPFEQFKSRTCIVLSLAKAIGGNPGLRCGIVYCPDMELEGKVEQIGVRAGTLMLDSTTAVASVVQHAFCVTTRAKLGKGPQELIEKYQQWDKNMRKTYSDSCALASRLFGGRVGFSLLVEPMGAFFAVISGRSLIGKPVPDSVTLLNGRVVKDLPSKVGETTFTKDVSIAYYLIYAAEVVTVPVSGFEFDATKGALRISLAVAPEVLEECAARLENAAKYVLTPQS
jgi:aspartate/methionine/tyrosine aminotransferase